MPHVPMRSRENGEQENIAGHGRAIYLPWPVSE